MSVNIFEIARLTVRRNAHAAPNEPTTRDPRGGAQSRAHAASTRRPTATTSGTCALASRSRLRCRAPKRLAEGWQSGNRDRTHARAVFRAVAARIVTTVGLVHAFIGCGDALGPTAIATGSHVAPIINGSPLVGDLAVVALVISDMPGRESLTCTGTLVSSHVVVAAGHCLSFGGQTFAPGYVFFGDDLAAGGDLRHVKKWLTHPKYKPEYTADFRIENDIGVLILVDTVPTEVVPYPLARNPPTVGQPARFAGFGCREVTGCPSGEKYEVTTAITAVSERDFEYGLATCGGDSGGPAFLVQDGIEVLGGVTSSGDIMCDTYGVDTRVDVFAPWIARVIAGEDPSTCIGADCPCAADGRCSVDCSRPGNDPDCPADCGADGTCDLDCPERDVDCPVPLADRHPCALDSDCASDVCEGTCRLLCNPEAEVPCAPGLRCEQGRFGAYACVSSTAASGCNVGDHGGARAPMPGLFSAFGLSLGFFVWRRAPRPRRIGRIR